MWKQKLKGSLKQQYRMYVCGQGWCCNQNQTTVAFGILPPPPGVEVASLGARLSKIIYNLTDVLSQLRFILPKWLRKCWNLVHSISALCQRMCCSVLAMKTCSVHFSKVFIKNQLDDPSTYVLAYYEWTCMLFFRYRGYLKCLCIN